MKKEVSSKQLGVLLFISILAFKLTFFPACLYKYANTDSIISFLILIILNLLSFFLVFYVLYKNPNTTFFEFLEKRIGSFGSKIIYLIIFIFFLFKIIFLFSGSYYFVREAIFHEANLIVFLLTMFVLINSIYLFKLNSLTRTAELFYPFIIFAFVLIVVLGLFTSESESLLPLFTNTADNIFEGVYRCFFCFGDYIFLLLFMGKVDFKKIKSKVFTYVFSTLIILSVFVGSFYSYYKYTAFIHTHAITDVIEFVPLSQIIENLDWLPTTLMLLLFFFQGALYFYCLMDSTKNIFKFKKFFYDTRWLLIPINILLFCLIYYVFYSYDFLIYFGENIYNIVNLCIVFFVSIFTFILSLFKKQQTSKNKFAIKYFNEDLKWISEMPKFKSAFKKKLKVGEKNG